MEDQPGIGEHRVQDSQHVRTEMVVRPEGRGIPAGRRDQDPADHRDDGQTTGDEGRAHPPTSRHQQIAPEPRHQQPHVLLDQQQGKRRERAVQHPAAVEAFDHHGGQQGYERHLVEVEAGGLGDSGGGRVGHRDEVGGHRTEPAPREHPQRRDRQGEQHGLGHDQGGRRVVDPVERRQHRQDGREVVGQLEEVQPLPVERADGWRGRRTEPRVPAYGLVEDHQVERGRAKVAELEETHDGVRDGGERRDRGDPAVVRPEPREPEPGRREPVRGAGGALTRSRARGLNLAVRVRRVG